MDTYIQNQLVLAEDLLESGIAFKGERAIRRALSIYKKLSDLDLDNETYKTAIVENAVRGCSFMCIIEPRHALRYLDIAFTYAPDHPVVLNNFGFLYHTQCNDYAASVRSYEKCIAKNPTYQTAYLGLLDVFRQMRHHSLELKYAQLGVKNCPDSAELYNCLGLSYLNNHMYKDINKIHACFQKGIALKPSDEAFAKLLVNKGHLASVLGDVDDALNHYLDAVAKYPLEKVAYSNILLNLLYVIDPKSVQFQRALEMAGIPYDPLRDVPLSTHVRRLHQAFAENIVDVQPDDVIEPPEWPSLFEDAVLIVGFVTSDLIDHAVSHFLDSFLQHYNSAKTHVFIYSNTVYDDDKVAQVRCHGYRCIVNWNGDQCAARIREDRVSVLIDLSGHTCGHRFDIFALKPAPTCLSYLGYPSDTGFSQIHRISDAYTEKHDPYGEPTRVILPSCFLRYTLSPDEREILLSRKKRQGTWDYTFGCFAKLQKINKQVISAFIRILQRVPLSRLVLKSLYFEDASIARKWRAKFGNVGDRVLLLKGQTTHAKHLLMFDLIDLHLDTFPYSGTTITCNALLMDVPVITLAPDILGTSHVQRVSGSILKHIHREDLIAASIEEYVDLAVKKSTTGHQRDGEIRDDFIRYMVDDAEHFAKEFECQLRETSHKEKRAVSTHIALSSAR